MRTLGEANKEHDDFSKRASENVRFLALAGLGLVWMLAGSKLDGLRQQRDILVAAIVLVLVLLADFGHYWFAARTWDGIIRRAEAALPLEKVKNDTEIEVPATEIDRLYYPYWAKLILLTLAYLVLLYAMVSRLIAPSAVCM